VRAAGVEREIGQQRLSFARRQSDRASRLEPGLQAAEERQAQTGHGVPWAADHTTFDATFNARPDARITPASYNGRMSEPMTFIVRITRTEGGSLQGVVERVKTGRKERVETIEEIGRVIAAAVDQSAQGGAR